MKENKEMTEQELDQVTGGRRFIINPDSMYPTPESRLGIIHPNYKVGRVGSNPTPHPKVVKGRYGGLNPDSM